LGSVVRITDPSGANIGVRRYTAFGVIEDGAVSGHAYTGREWDAAIGLAYYRARYYDPHVGRFLSQDPVGLRLPKNKYIYAHGNPLRYYDPSGLTDIRYDQRQADQGLNDVCSVTTSASHSAALLDSRIRDCADKKCAGPDRVKVFCGEGNPYLCPRKTKPWNLGVAAFGTNIALCDSAFTSPCTLKNTILHEMLHTCIKPEQITHLQVNALADQVFPVTGGCK
jgi:RHS repeat-associated protein